MVNDVFFDYEFADSRELGASGGWTFDNGSPVSPEKLAWKVWACLPLALEGHVLASPTAFKAQPAISGTEPKSPEEKSYCNH